jgi:hypothetical protein
MHFLHIRKWPIVVVHATGIRLTVTEKMEITDIIIHLISSFSNGVINIVPTSNQTTADTDSLSLEALCISSFFDWFLV